MTQTLVALAVLASLAPLLIWILVRSKGARRRLAPVAGMMLLLGAFFRVDPPPPPRTEASPREDGNADSAGAPPIA